MSIAHPAAKSLVDEKLRATAEDALNFAGRKNAESDPTLARLRELGTELWLDTGNLEEAQSLWKSQFSAATTLMIGGRSERRAALACVSRLTSPVVIPE